MRVLVFEAGRTPFVTELDGWEGLRELIGGDSGPATIERITLEPDLDLWLDEDGISKGLPPNLFATGPLYTGAPIFGTAVLAYSTVDAEGESTWLDVTRAQAERALLMLRSRAKQKPGGECVCGAPDDGHFPDCQPAPLGAMPPLTGLK